MKKQVELSITHNGKDVVAYPYTKKEHVQFENGMNIDEFVGQDIATPTITHDTTAIKVGVGDSDVSSSVVDSAVNMTIKGQTCQNILPEPTLRNEMQGKSMQRLNEGYDSIETVDGVSKSAILKGQTLVNVDSYYSKDDFVDSHIFNLTDDGWVEMVANGNYRNAFTRFNGMIKPNTKYLAVVEVKENTLVNETLPERPFYLFANYSNPDGGVVVPFVDQTKWISQGQKGLFKYILTSRGDLSTTTINLRNFVASTTTSGRIIYRTMLIEYVEGMENWDIPFFRGIQSVKMPVLQTLGSNIFDGETESGHIDSSTGQNSNAWNDLRSVGYIEVIGGNMIRILVTHENFSSPKIYEYDENKNFIGKVENHTLSPHAKFVRFSIGGNTDVGGVSQVMLYYGDIVKREYEPYKTNILSCQLAPLNQTMFEQGTFAETTPPNTQSYEQIKLGSEHLYTTRIRTKGTYKVVKGATYEVRLNDGYGIDVCYCKNGLYSATVNRWLDGTSTFTVPNDCDEMFFAIRKTDNTAIAPSDYPLIGLKIHQEVILRSLPNDTKDTLNLNTGEYVQRIGEVTLNGSEEWVMDNEASDSKENTSIFHTQKFTQFKKLEVNERNSGIVCNGYPVKGDVYGSDVEGIMFNHVNVFYFRVKKSVANNVGDFKQWLSQNPKEVQLELATPIIKTVDLSSHENWEKVVLDGDENWQHESNFAHNNLIEFKLTIGNGNIVSVISDRFATGGNDVERIACTAHRIYIRILKSKVNNLDEFKQWLQQNPTTVWYQTTTTQDNSIREMLSFANGHLQVSSEAENSLLPTVQYEIPTKNSYHMDLMKTNTLYTMKAKSVSGTFTIDGTSYNVDANGTFTSPSSMTDKLLIMSNKTNEEVMVLEGNVVDKTIPYFKGIKSAFEGEDKIEVLSVGKNLFDYSINNIYTTSSRTEYAPTFNEDGSITINSCYDNPYWLKRGFYVEKGKEYTVTVTGMRSGDYSALCFGFDNLKYLGGGAGKVLIPADTTGNCIDTVDVYGTKSMTCTALETGYITRFYIHDSGLNSKYTILEFQVEESLQATTYETYKSNTTKIPLLHPLRSLPNGVCDELIIDRLNHKAKLIQRIGYEVLNENTAFSSYPKMEKEKTLLFQTQNANPQGASTYCISDQFIHGNNLWDSSDSDTEAIVIGGGEGNIGKRIDFRISKAKVSTNNVTILQDYLSKEPITVLYQLNIPIITEIDLEGYPYAYKDGHIFLNSDIAPTTQITYSINQAQQIESANESLQRHEKEISHLQKLIAQYIQVEYESTLLSLKI